MALPVNIADYINWLAELQHVGLILYFRLLVTDDINEEFGNEVD